MLYWLQHVFSDEPHSGMVPRLPHLPRHSNHPHHNYHPLLTSLAPIVCNKYLIHLSTFTLLYFCLELLYHKTLNFGKNLISRICHLSPLRT